MSETEKLSYREKEDKERLAQNESKTVYISKKVSQGKRFKITRPVDFPLKGKTAYVFFVKD